MEGGNKAKNSTYKTKRRYKIIRMQKLVSSGTPAMNKIKEGVDLVVNPVKSTISPNGTTVIISESFIENYSTKNQPLRVSKDGYSVAMKITSPDPEVQVGVLFAQQAAEKQMIDAGDATSTCCLFTQALLDKGLTEIEKGESHVKIKNGVNEAVDNIVEQLKAMAIPVNGDIGIIKKIATTSANGDEEIGSIIADAYKEIGNDGVIKIERSKGVNTTIKITGGMTFGKGWASQHFINSSKEECILHNPYILIVDEHLVQMKDIMPLLVKINQTNEVNGEKRPLMIFCNRSDGEALATFIVNHQKKILESCVVQMDFLGEKKVEFMQDIAVATGGIFISENTGGKLDEIEISQLGNAESVVVSQNETTIIGGVKNQVRFDKLISELKELEQQEEDINVKDLLQKRIARLNSSVAILSVGGITEVEMEERLERVDDATRAVKCAIQEGYTAGGGIAFLRCKETGNSIVDSILNISLKQICENSGVNFNETLSMIPKDGVEYGYNAKTNEVGNLVTQGIIEPVKSNICALKNAASIVLQILSSKFMLTDTL